MGWDGMGRAELCAVVLGYTMMFVPRWTVFGWAVFGWAVFGWSVMVGVATT
jgi:hypothetical protein